jgi:serine-type D-Ala-D-Ala carboxypeptidase (penicillin-binding protein 5/6)
MKMYVFILTVILSIFFTTVTVSSENRQLYTSCKGCVLMEADSNRVLYQKNAHDQMYIASITKILTAVVAIEEGYLEDYVTISEEATKQVGSSIYVKPGEQVKLIDLIYGLLLRSGNDAAYAIAEHVAGDVNSFVYLMNEKAKELGMKNSVFENPSGLDETTRNLSTAYDMALLMSYAVDNPIYMKINDTSKHRAETIDGRIFVFHNKHRLINAYDFITGGKTGYTERARRTLVTSARKNGMDLVVVTLNDSNDWDDHMNLFEYGFSQYENRHLLDDGMLYVKELDQLFTFDDDITYPLTDGEINDCEFIIDKKEEKYYLYLMHKEKIVLTRPLEEYQYLHKDLPNFFDLSLKEQLKEVRGYWIW